MQNEELKAAVERLSAFLDNPRASEGSLIFRCGKTARPDDLRLVLAALRPSPEAVGEMERRISEIRGWLTADHRHYPRDHVQALLDAYDALQSRPPVDQGEWGLDTPEIVDYVARWGGMCRSCADEGGVCPNSGLPCDGHDRAIRHVLRALSYGLTHRFIAAAPLPPEKEEGNG